MAGARGGGAGVSGEKSARINLLESEIVELRASAEELRMIAKNKDEICEELARKVIQIREVAIDAAASLAAAISLLERSPKKAAPSDKMFDQMLVDYRASLDRARAVLAPKP